MREVGRDYAAYVNRRYARTGSLWERPFRSCLVDSASYVLNCYRYIERNPVRAGMVARPGDHHWSSYAGNAALSHDALLTPHVEYAALGTFLRAMREATHAGFPLVGEHLKVRLEKQGARLDRGKPGPRAEPEARHDDKSLQLELTE
jgi:hypothetical protein